MLEIRDLVCGYGGVTALRGISLDVKAGQLVALIGANGAGKSTTLRAISGLVPPRAGSLMFDGKNMSGEENLAMGAYLRTDASDVAVDRDRIYGEFPRLAERRKQAAGTLSGGEQQMLAIGRA